MATIAINRPFSAFGTNTIVQTELTGADTFAASNSARQLLVVRNDTLASVTINIAGADADTVNLAGLAPSIDISGGYDLIVPADAVRSVTISSIKEYLVGAIAVTGGDTDVFAYIIEG
jgi:hypothetical protein